MTLGSSVQSTRLLLVSQKYVRGALFSVVSSNGIAPKEEIEYYLSALGAITNADIS